MIAREYSCFAYWQERYGGLVPRMAFTATDPEGYARWRQAFGPKYEECLGEIPKGGGPLDVTIEEEVKGPDYTRRKIVYSADAYSRIPAYLFLPRDAPAPAPAIICPHGHGRGKVDPAGVAATESDAAHIRAYNYDYAEQFARRGYVTLAPDARCFGERTDDPAEVYGHMQIREGDHWCDVNFVLGMLIGVPLLGLHVFDIGRGIDLLQGLAEVDGTRIGAVGLSFGGALTLFSAAHDQRISVAGVSGYFNSWRSYPMINGELCGSEVVPGLLRYGDHAEVAGLIAPRPLFVELGTRDPLFPVEAGRASFETLGRIYALAGAADRVESEVFPGAHVFRGNRIFDFFARWL
jgi:dienelactone hydrolase